MATRYVSQPHAYLLRNRTETAMPEKVKGSVQTLLGQRLVADPANAVDDWTPILTPDGETRWIKTSQLSDRQQLKVFYTDVGQGDATIIEAEGAIVIIDESQPERIAVCRGCNHPRHGSKVGFHRVRHCYELSDRDEIRIGDRRIVSQELAQPDTLSRGDAAEGVALVHDVHLVIFVTVDIGLQIWWSKAGHVKLLPDADQIDVRDLLAAWMSATVVSNSLASLPSVSPDFTVCVGISDSSV